MYPPAYDFPIALKMNSTKKSAETTFFVPKGIFFLPFLLYNVLVSIFIHRICRLFRDCRGTVLWQTLRASLTGRLILWKKPLMLMRNWGRVLRKAA